ncbi:MAG: hypothetical protein GTO03_06140 [Planctomycetales bacterium]|nr:hypothetical protein [Planctomycetales bacterium]
MLSVDGMILLALVVARVAPLVMLAPIFGARSLPLPLSGLLAIVLSLLIAPLQVAGGVVPPPQTGPLLLALASETLTGLSLALAVLVVFQAAELAGRLIAGSSGLVFSDGAADQPAGPAPAQLLTLVALAVFVTTGGHRLVMAALLDSFQALPPGSGLLPADLTDTATQLLAAAFALAVRAAAPVIVAVLVANLAVGVLQRSVPQVNSLVVGLGLNLGVALTGLFLALGAIAYLLGDQIAVFLQIWQQPL